MFRLAAGFSVGVVAVATAPFVAPWPWMLAAVFPLALLRRLFLAAVMVGCAWAAWHAERELARWLPLSEQGREVEVTARVSGLPLELGQGWRIPLVLEERPADLPVRHVQLYWHGRFGAPAAGERWALTLRLRRPSGHWNPEGFDGERWALTQRIHA